MSQKPQSNMDGPGRPKCSVYPHHPPNSQFLVRCSEAELTFLDRVLVAGSSLFIVGSVVWVPLCIAWSWKRWRRVKDEKRKTLYAGLGLAAMALAAAGPHRTPRFAEWVRLKHWRLWKSWMRFIAMEIILDRTKVPPTASSSSAASAMHKDVQNEKAMLAFSPHGIFPFSLAIPALLSHVAMGSYRPVVAPATRFFPVVRNFLSCLQKVDASRSVVSKALSDGFRIGILPGGIAEIFASYPKPLTHPDEEYIIVRKGFLRLALQHGVPVMPIYCFGATKMFKRLNIPILESLSRWLRVSVCVFYGVLGLPIPFRRKMSYVIGDTILPPPSSSSESSGGNVVESKVEELHDLFCRELLRLFDRHKEAYGWGHKTLKILTQ